MRRRGQPIEVTFADGQPPVTLRPGDSVTFSHRVVIDDAYGNPVQQIERDFDVHYPDRRGLRRRTLRIASTITLPKSALMSTIRWSADNRFRHWGSR